MFESSIWYSLELLRFELSLAPITLQSKFKDQSSKITFRQMLSAACLASRDRMRSPSEPSNSRSCRTRSIDRRSLIGSPLMASSQLRIKVSSCSRPSDERAEPRLAISEREL